MRKSLFFPLGLGLVVVSIYVGVSQQAWGLNRNYRPAPNKPVTVGQAKEDDNNFLGFSYFLDQLPDGKRIRMIGYHDGGHILAYGEAAGEIKEGEQRFLGVNRLGENISNFDFPNDAPPEGLLEEQQWIFTPWENQDLSIFLQRKGEKIKENWPFDGDPAFLPNIIQGLKAKLPGEFGGSPALEWHKIVHILQPPTYYGWGVGRAWHKKADGSIWYRTIPIAPSKVVVDAQEQPNLQVSMAGYRGNPRPGQEIQVTAQVVNSAGRDMTTGLVWKVNGQVVSTVSDFTAAAGTPAAVTFRMPAADARVEVIVNPERDRPADESSWSDNGDALTIPVLNNPVHADRGDVSVELLAPAQVDAGRSWQYQVRVSFRWVQTYTSVLVSPAKEKKPAVYRDEPDDPPVIGLTLGVRGTGKHSERYDPRLGVNFADPVTQSDQQDFFLTGGTSRTLTFTFPATALMNEGYYVQLEANLSNGAADSAQVYIKPFQVEGPKALLTPSG